MKNLLSSYWKSTVWQPLPHGCLKLNIDAAIRGDKGFIGVGVVIKDDSSLIVVVSSKILVGNFQVEMGELLALREGLLLVKNLGCRVYCWQRWMLVM
ncbi:hypothetical protein Dsin_002012 [Dipteronia sinensis]|uniref:RNase H type-1 domain-containing protein n=1 Tax=Dipteronia sinensis TaxID=43782 RepID=A0AAE0B5G1_9ROSI|nr:hypothetical protein Dsin_002012 [Dipteronia sinensis]